MKHRHANRELISAVQSVDLWHWRCWGRRPHTVHKLKIGRYLNSFYIIDVKRLQSLEKGVRVLPYWQPPQHTFFVEHLRMRRNNSSAQYTECLSPTPTPVESDCWVGQKRKKKMLLSLHCNGVSQQEMLSCAWLAATSVSASNVMLCQVEKIQLTHKQRALPTAALTSTRDHGITN
ncbi:uncharacterized protein LOC144209110 [Stigmatopora nigra]